MILLISSFRKRPPSLHRTVDAVATSRHIIRYSTVPTTSVSSLAGAGASLLRRAVLAGAVAQLQSPQSTRPRPCVPPGGAGAGWLAPRPGLTPPLHLSTLLQGLAQTPDPEDKWRGSTALLDCSGAKTVPCSALRAPRRWEMPFSASFPLTSQPGPPSPGAAATAASAAWPSPRRLLNVTLPLKQDLGSPFRAPERVHGLRALSAAPPSLETITVTAHRGVWGPHGAVTLSQQV